MVEVLTKNICGFECKVNLLDIVGAHVYFLNSLHTNNYLAPPKI